MTRNNRIAGLIVGFICLEIILIAFVDRPVSLWMRELDQIRPDLINVFRAITDIGKSKGYLITSGILVLIGAMAVRVKFLSLETRQAVRLYADKSLFFFSAVAVSGINADAIKPILGRGRPVEMVRDGIYGFHPLNFHAAWNSMPSGHATTVFALAGVLCIWFPRWRVFWLILAAFLAFTRVMVNAHFIADILAGGVIGLVTVAYIHRFWGSKMIHPILARIFPIDR